MNRTILFLALTLFSLYPTIALSLNSDKEAVLHVRADSADMDQSRHEGLYIGHVSLKKGASHLRAHWAKTSGDASNQLVLAIAKGNGEKQAHYWTRSAPDKPVLHAYADEIYYYPKQHLIELRGNARVVQGDNSFTAPIMKYDMLKQHLTSNKQGDQRIHITYYPDKKA